MGEKSFTQTVGMPLSMLAWLMLASPTACVTTKKQDTQQNTSEDTKQLSDIIDALLSTAPLLPETAYVKHIQQRVEIPLKVLYMVAQRAELGDVASQELVREYDTFALTNLMQSGQGFTRVLPLTELRSKSTEETKREKDDAEALKTFLETHEGKEVNVRLIERQLYLRNTIGELEQYLHR